MFEADCTEANLGQAILRRVNGQRAKFRGAKLASAKLNDADLSGADFEGASLQSAHFEGATLNGVNFEYANIYDAYFTGAVMDEATVRSLSKAKNRERAHLPWVTVKIGLIAATSGDSSAFGLGMRNGAELAVRQANTDKAITGWRIEYVPKDDTGKPHVGAQVATKLASDAEVVGVAGTFNSSVAQQVQPILDKANIVMVSPANTDPSLTQGPDWAKGVKRRRAASYFRVATTDAIQGPFAARYVYEDLKLAKVATVHDKKAYGEDLVSTFAVEFEKRGGQIVGAETVNPDDRDFSAVTNGIKREAPHLVYYDGEYPGASLLSNQMKAEGLAVPLMGGDGIFDPTYIQNAGEAAEGDFATSIGAPPEMISSAKSFITSYSAANYREPFGAYGSQAYDSASAIIEALKATLPGKSRVDDSVRAEIVRAMGKVSFDGATGKVAFDEYGDITAISAHVPEPDVVRRESATSRVGYCLRLGQGEALRLS